MCARPVADGIPPSVDGSIDEELAVQAVDGLRTESRAERNHATSDGSLERVAKHADARARGHHDALCPDDSITRDHAVDRVDSKDPRCDDLDATLACRRDEVEVEAGSVDDPPGTVGAEHRCVLGERLAGPSAHGAIARFGRGEGRLLEIQRSQQPNSPAGQQFEPPSGSAGGCRDQDDRGSGVARRDGRCDT
jgi:hypothetical protein